ncbi:hypothetical protein [Paenibacillus graminis]|uniref:hypothetical protein n=1 Tax=Paenibacillus graminis TaxID=189425 RepID=UPI00046EDF69|nr:hypothetical protein [Paenibacillus graminis]
MSKDYEVGGVVMWDSILFLFFSTVEAFSLYFLIMCLFRFRWEEHAWQALVLVLLINLQSFILRNEFQLGGIMPIVTIFYFILFFAIFVRIPLGFSIILTISGYVIFGVVQTGLAILFFGSIGEAQATDSNGYVLQLASGSVIMILSWLFYRTGHGFTFELHRLRFKFEDIMVVLLIILFFIGISLLMFYNEIYINILFFTAISAYLLYYATRKDREND